MDFEKKVIEIDINDILPNRFQPRLRFSEESINELALSIKEHGVIQPIVVRKIDDKFEIIAGERRYKASLIAGNKSIPAIVTDLNDKDSAEVALIENVQRKDLTPIEEAISYRKILDMGYMTQEDLALKLGKTQSTVANKLRLLNLTEETQEALLDEKISERHARSLLKLQNTNLQNQMLDRVINERMTVRKTDEEIDKMINENKESSTVNSPVSAVSDSPSQFDIIEEVIDEIPTSPIFDDKNNLPEIPVVSNIQNVVTEIKKPELGSFDSIFNPQPEMAISSTPQELKIPPLPIEEFDNVPTIVNIDAIKESSFENLFGPVAESKPEVISISEPSKPNNFIVDPGFMDIEKIQKEAMDINPQKQEPDMNNLMLPTEIEGVLPNEVLNPPIVETKNDNMASGKFFNMISEEYNDEEDEDTNLQSLNSFNFNFDEADAKIDNESPITASTNLETQQVLAPQQTVLSNNPFEIFNLNPVVHEDRNKALAESQSQQQIDVPTPILDFAPVAEVPTPVMDFTPVAEVLTPVMDFAPVAEVPTPIMDFAPVAEVPTPVMDFAPVAEVPTPVMDFAPVAEVPTPIMDFAPVAEVPTPIMDFETMGSINTIPSLNQEISSIPSAPITEPAALTKNFKDALNAIRECNSKIEKMGFDIDTEEFDFEDIYQVIFKINK